MNGIVWLSVVSQKDCPETKDMKLKIFSQTFVRGLYIVAEKRNGRKKKETFLAFLFLLVPSFTKIACFNIGSNLRQDVLGDLTHLVKQDKFIESIRACAELAFSRSYQFFALGDNGLCWSGPNARQRYYIKGSTKETNCPNGIGKEKRIAVFTFGKFTLRNMSCNI